MKLSIGIKIGGGFAVSLIIVALIGVFSYITSTGLFRAAALVARTHLVVEELDAVLQGMTDAETAVRGYIIVREDAFLQPYQAGITSATSSLKTLRQLTATNPAQQRLLDKIEQLVQAKLRTLAQQIADRKSDRSTNAKLLPLIDEAKGLMDEIRTALADMKSNENELLGIQNAESRKSQERLVAVIIYGIPISLLLMILIGFITTRNISRPINRVAELSKRIAAGDLNDSVRVETRSDEVGVLSRAFGRLTVYLQAVAAAADRIAEGDLTVKVDPQSDKDVIGVAFGKMVTNLKRITSELRDAVETLGASASEILATTTQVAVAATETATGVNETTTTVQEVKQTAQVANQKARLVADGAERSRQFSRAGTASVNETVSGMNRIREQMELIAESTVRLSEQSQAIGEIITVVGDLAEQSNVLAVNASIEAAKAGDQGKGFAVIALEIKSLADQSRRATSQVRTILGDIQKATTVAVLAAEQGSKAVENGVTQSSEVTNAIRVLGESIESAAMASTQISASSQEQVVGMDQIALAMESIRTASTQNIASTGQAENAAQQLHELGRRLKDLIAQFRI